MFLLRGGNEAFEPYAVYFYAFSAEAALTVQFLLLNNIEWLELAEWSLAECD